jgi:hypothetical protein
MQQLLNAIAIEKSIKAKLGKTMSKAQLSLSLGYLGFKYEKCLLENDEERAAIYLNFMDAVQQNYNKFKEVMPFVLDESKRLPYLDN